MASAPVPVEVEVIEPPNTTPTRYRDAVKLAGGDVVLVMTDAADERDPTPAEIAAYKQIVRREGSSGEQPSGILRALNQATFESGRRLGAACARVSMRDRLVSVASAGTSGPLVVRTSGRIARARALETPTAPLGQVRAAKFVDRSIELGRGDCVLLPSLALAGPLDEMLAKTAPVPTPIADWLRSAFTTKPGGLLLCLVVG